MFSSFDNEWWKTPIKYSLATTAATVLSVIVSKRYHIAKPHQYLVKTGLCINDLKLCKTTIRWPLQEVSYVDLRPSNYNFNLHNMSKEKVEFKLPINFTIGPMNPLEDKQGFENYVKCLNEMDGETLSKTILGIVEGETRGLTSILTIEEMFNAKEKFKDDVVVKIQEHLRDLGLKVYNANIREMGDYDPDNQYFEYRKQKAIQSANYEAKVEVSEAKKQGEIGMKEREKDTVIAVATLNMETKLAENEREKQIIWSQSTLEQEKSHAKMVAEMKRLDTEIKTKQYEQELLIESEKKRKEREIVTLRATEWTKTNLQSEQKTRQAEADAQVIKMMAEAEADAIKIRADATLQQEVKRAEAIKCIMEAHANGLKCMTDTQQDSELVKYYLGLKENLYLNIAKTQAEAFQGLKPKFHIWSTGTNANKEDPSSVITKTLQNMAPLFSGLQQSGIHIPYLTSPSSSSSPNVSSSCTASQV